MAIIVAPLSRDLTKFPVGTTGARLDEASLRFKRYQLSLDLNCLYEESEIWPRSQPILFGSRFCQRFFEMLQAFSGDITKYSRCKFVLRWTTT